MNKIFLVGPTDASDFTAVHNRLADADWRVHFETGSLARNLKVLTDCQAVCLLDTWWTDEQAHYLMTAASWMRMTFIHPVSLNVLDVSSAKR